MSLAARQNRAAFGVALCVSIASCSANKPPPDDVVATILHAHEATFSRLREMLEEEDRVREIASWGIRVADSPASSVPPNADMSLSRYQAYHALLAQAHSLAASRSADPKTDACFLVWAAGWAADTKHVSVCWRDAAPDVLREPSAKGAKSGVRAWTYSLIEGHWYVQRD